MSARSERELLGYREGVAEVLALPPATLQALAPAAAGARSQLGQDLFALYANGVERGGYFVEFGATDGRTLSNTYLLEDGYGWRGILAEPARKWHDALRANRGCHIETDCVWRATGERLAFLEAGVGELSTIAQFAGADHHAGARRGAREYTVRTISLLDLLDKYDAPPRIDYLSVDTEGSEFDILSAFDFSRYRFGAITVEHNHTPRRADLHALLARHGYERRFEGLSMSDDWYVPRAP